MSFFGYDKENVKLKEENIKLKSDYETLKLQDEDRILYQRELEKKIENLEESLSVCRMYKYRKNIFDELEEWMRKPSKTYYEIYDLPDIRYKKW